MKNNPQHNNNFVLLRAVGIALLFVFINFTVIVPCLNFSGLNLSITEMVEEEEEQEEHKSELHELMVHTTLRLEEELNHSEPVQIMLVHHSEVMTPPPERI